MANVRANEVGVPVSELEQQLAGFLQRRQDAHNEFQNGKAVRKSTFKKEHDALQERHQSENEEHQRHFSEAREALTEKIRRRKLRANDSFRRLQEPVVKQRRDEIERCQKELKAAQDRFVEDERGKWAACSSQNESIETEFSTLGGKVHTLKAKIDNLADSLGVDLGNNGEDSEAKKNADEDPSKDSNDSEAMESTAEVVKDVRAFLDGMNDQLVTLGVSYQRLSFSLASLLGRRSSIALSLLLVAVGHLIWLKVLFGGSAQTLQLMWVALSFVASFVFVYFIGHMLRGRTKRTAQKLYADARTALASVRKQEQVNKDRHWAQYRGLVDERIGLVGAAEQKINLAGKEKKDGLEKSLMGLRGRKDRLLDYIRISADQAKVNLQKNIASSAQAMAQRHEDESADLEGTQKAQEERAENLRGQVFKDTAEAWASAISGTLAYGEDALNAAHARHKEWEALVQGEDRWASEFPVEVMLGQIDIPMAQLEVPHDDDLHLPKDRLTLPLSLSFPGCGSLVIQAGAKGRPEALDILFQAALRILADFPPGMAELTVIDPVGLGQNFSALMELGDYDDALIGGRIWTESSHIEKRLSELTEHVEKVIQKYLRNRYATIDEYNASAGEMKEAYQFLLLSDLPTGLSDLALDRLASIVNSGPQCGVYVLIFHDTRQKWAKQIDWSQIQRSAMVLKESAEGFVEIHEGLKRGVFKNDAAPKSSTVSSLLSLVGSKAKDAKRVELSFGTAVPKPDEIWSRNTNKSICVPVGRSGAVRLQELELGRGTAQHCLVAGRTGSGKSTLFQVLITNASLWYSPQELEFYLIDFKKGVEFKVFANHKLPHAQVIAIESDREFGLAVLKRLDEELNRRGELFRDAGVQDLASYRSTPNAICMPRTMLLIDEFQEFFTEDDAVSQEATLLLDRFVRQGRAFGVHLVLGSQTLSGVYTLAKSTLGQMGVRIALQCNESDSYLILSDDNGAARLLSRPGEAIYNDMSGLVEGNMPFQVVWLPDEDQTHYLTKIADKADREGARPERDTIVFESNAPAQLDKNVRLEKCIQGEAFEQQPGQTVWLGEPNAIKGPTEARFTANGGSNLLMIGQRKEAAFGMMCSTILSLAATNASKKLRFIVFDGGGADEQFAEWFERLAGVIPHSLEMIPYREVAHSIAALDAEIKSSQDEGVPPDQHTFLLIFGLPRFRTLREEDDFSFSSSSDDGPKTGEQFANVIRDGPEQQIHSVIWCDNLANANRTLSRRTMREFDQTVLFQMSAADSSELTDTPAANTLGLHNALLYVESDGRLEKFRPYALPGKAWIEEVKKSLRRKIPVSDV